MRLSDFIATNTEQILSEWEVFARTHSTSGQKMDVVTLRDHASAMLSALCKDLNSPQTDAQRDEKSKGDAEAVPSALDTPAETHGALRAEAGFTLDEMIAEFRALRASVLRLWGESSEGNLPADLADMLRFNEAIDQALAESISRYSRDLEHSKEMFLAILGHDVRTPLGAILMSAAALLAAKDLSVLQQKAALRILSSGARIKEIVSDLLDFTRTRLGAGIPLQRGNMDLRETTRQAVEEIAASHPEHDLQFQSSGPLEGKWDNARLAQALSNLIGNAVQHGAAETPVSVTATGNAEGATVTVHNYGPVIAPIHMHQIFSPLKRIDRESARADYSGSMGLGLYIAQEIVKGHGGRIDVTSSEASGTTFAVYLPR